MAQYTLVIGNKAYSSWSLRPWLAMKHTGLAFDEVRIPLYQDDHARKICRYSAAGKVPVLVDGGTTVWDSLAICEYLAERHADKQLWPPDAAVRAYGRAISAEMHAGFVALRSSMNMNVRREFPGIGMNGEVAADIARIEAIWSDSLKRYGGPFLLGGFSIADAMYAPVATRFKTYAVALSGAAQRYIDMLLDLPAMRAWYAGARAETEVLPQYEHQR
ncbi:MAG: glutathione S-transferase family protein [Burkholderiales bacterium]